MENAGISIEEFPPFLLSKNILRTFGLILRKLFIDAYLVGGWTNPFEYSSKWESFPPILGGENTKIFETNT